MENNTETYYFTNESNDVFMDNTSDKGGGGDGTVEAPSYLVITATVFYILIFVVGVLGNILVVVVVTCSRTMKTSVNLYLVNLCVADILVILVCMPTALTDIYARDAWYFGEIMCKAVPFLENTVANASVLTILAISVERYRVVCYPLKGIENTTMKVLRIVIGVWIAAIITSAPWISIPTLRRSKYRDGTPVTVCRNPIKHTWQNLYIILLFVLFFLVPCVLLFVLNCHLCRVLRNTHENDPRIPGNDNIKERKRRRHQVVNIIASIVSIFFICHLPCRLVFLWFSFGDKNVIYELGLEFNLVILYSARIMFYLNHAINPVVYNFVSTKFRNALKEICYKRRLGYTAYASMTLNRHRRNDAVPSFYMNTMPSMSTKQLRLSNKWAPPVQYDIKTYTNRRVFKSQNLSTNSGVSRSSNENSSSSCKDYDVKIRLENKTVAFKFNLNGQAENDMPVNV